MSKRIITRHDWIKERYNPQRSVIAQGVLKMYRPQLTGKSEDFDEMLEEYKTGIDSENDDDVFRSLMIKKYLRDIRKVDVDEVLDIIKRKE